MARTSPAPAAPDREARLARIAAALAGVADLNDHRARRTAYVAAGLDPVAMAEDLAALRRVAQARRAFTS